jgi:hypothetical protein
MDDMIARVVVSDQDVLRTLLTTTQYYVPASHTASGTEFPQRIFNIGTDVAVNRTARWATMNAAERAGVLTHPAWLAAHGGNFEDDPSLVGRGKWIRESLLCQYVPPLSSVKVAAMVGPRAPDKTARLRVHEATEQPGSPCIACHKAMNPLGYPFEIYNHAGFLRSVEHDGSMPSGQSMLDNMPEPGLNGPVTDAVQLSRKLADSSHVRQCFVRQSFRYFAGRNETRADACTLVKMDQAYSKKGSFYTMLSALISSDAFLKRHAPKAGE